jgi:hypothetical protein
MAIALLISAQLSIGGQVLDALTGKPVRGAVVSDGKHGGTLTDEDGRFLLTDLSGEKVDLIVQHPSYVILAEPSVPAGTRVQIKLQPSSIQAEPVEIVERSEEDLRPMIVRQDPFKIPAEVATAYQGTDSKGLYRVCVGKDGKVSMVAALAPMRPIKGSGPTVEKANAQADATVKEGIAGGWEYRALLQPACFLWRVTWRFGGTRPPPNVIPPSREGMYAPPSSGFKTR